MSGYSCGISGIDDEYQKIIARLRMYGYEPTGNKSADRAKLHEIELREAKKENCRINLMFIFTRHYRL